jgi:cytochrome c oxidase subunit 2
VRWIWIGIAISFVPLLVSLIWTVAVLAHVGTVPRSPRLVIDVTARQWWWDARYDGAPPDRIFRTANEIHIPVGEPVLLRLHSADVIHSFWVPRLAGKMDVIPGQTNQVWVQADAPGRYRGQCAEYCGLQHAHMGFEVVAEPHAAFERWRTAQLQTAPPPSSVAQARGLALAETRCGVCHAIRGSRAYATAAPDLTHLMSRATIAAGTLPNNPQSLTGWIENPQSIKPGALMPDQGLSADQLNDLRAYLETLR